MANTQHSIVLHLQNHSVTYARYSWTTDASLSSTIPPIESHGISKDEGTIYTVLTQPGLFKQSLVSAANEFGGGPGSTTLIFVITQTEIRQNADFRSLPETLNALIEGTKNDDGNVFKLVAFDEFDDLNDERKGSITRHLRAEMSKECSRDMIVLTPAEDGVVKKCHLSHYQWKETDSEPKVFESAKNKAVIDKFIFDLTSADLQTALSFVSPLIHESRHAVKVPILLQAGPAIRGRSEFIGLQARLTKELGDVRLMNGIRFIMVPYKLPQGGDASARVSALAKERLKPKFAMVLFVERNVAAAWLYRWVAVDGIEGPRKLEVVGDKTFKAPTSGSGGIAWLEASLAPLAKLACANLPTRAGGVKLILLNSTAVQALPRHSTSGSYHTLCDALRACAKDIQGTRFDIEACPLIPGYEEADASKEYYHEEVLRSFFVRRALVLNNNKKDDHNMTLTLYGLELIDRTVPLGHVKLYKTQRSADVILDFEHDRNEISNLSAKQIDQFGKRQKNKDKKAVEAALKKAFNDALPWVPRLEGKVPVFFVGTVSSNEQIQRERYDAAIEMAKVYAKNWRYPGDSPPVQWEFIVAPPKDLSGETDDRVDDNEESSRERIWRYYNKYSVVVSNSKTTVYNWHDWAAGDRCLPPLEAISIWDTDSSTPNVIPDILKRARSFLPTYAGQVPVFVWHTGNTDPLPDTVEELRVVINSLPSPDGTTSFILAEFAAVPDNEIVLGAAVAQEYAIAAGTPNNSTIVNAAKARHGWWYSPTAKTYLEGRMFGVQSGGEILDVFVQGSPAVAAKDIRAYPMELYDLLVPGVEGVLPEGVLVGCAASELAQVKVGEDIKCNATSVHVCAEHKDGEGVELASGRKAFEEASTALRVLSIGFGMEVGWEGMDLGMEKWTMGRMALWATLNAQNDMWQ